MNTLHFRLLMLLFGTASACHLPPARMHVPTELAAIGDRYGVKGQVSLFARTVRFGPYRTRDAWIGSVRGSPSLTTILTPFRSSKEKKWTAQKARFTLMSPGGASFQSECRRETRMVVQHDKGLAWDSDRRLHMADDPRILDDTDTFRCAVTRPSAAPLELVLTRGLQGTVRGDGVEIDISATSEQDDQPFSTAGVQAGFLLTEAGRPVAAVDLTAAASVTLSREAPQPHKDELAAISMALLLLRDMD